MEKAYKVSCKTIGLQIKLRFRLLWTNLDILSPPTSLCFSFPLHKIRKLSLIGDNAVVFSLDYDEFELPRKLLLKKFWTQPSNN